MTLALSTHMLTTWASYQHVTGRANLAGMSAGFDRDAFAERVREERKRVGLSQAGLAEAVEVSTETVSRIERGAYEASLASAVAIALALGVELDYLVNLREETDRFTSRATSPVSTRLTSAIEKLSPTLQKALLKIVEELPEG